MKIAILGSRGIPNAYGGFEQFAEYLSQGLVALGHSVYVYNSHNHPYQKNIWRGVNIIHAFDPEKNIGTIGQFIYDLNCILDSRKRDFDLILQLGYTSNSVWHKLLPQNAKIMTNMDGLEWKRTKYNKLVRYFLHYAERLAAENSDLLVADSIGIKRHLQKRYNKHARYIPYGAHLFNNPAPDTILHLGLQLYDYDMLIARLEPENNIEMVLEGFIESGVDRDFVVIGDYFTEYGNYLKDHFNDDRIKFLGKIYDINILNNLRFYSNLYFHGHSVGGTNPSLLEAMASDALICAHDNIFNRSILDGDAFYFENPDDVIEVLTSAKKVGESTKIVNNRGKISKLYNWPRIIKSYEALMAEILGIELQETPAIMSGADERYHEKVEATVLVK